MSEATGSGPDPLSPLTADWTFTPSSPSKFIRLVRAKSWLTRIRRGPSSRAIRAVSAAPRWNAYFLFLETGQLTDRHRYTLERLRATSGRLLTVCAAPSVDYVPAELVRLSDAVYWKGLSGYDFSAYSLIVDEVAQRSPGSDVFLMNDSVLGPFGDLEAPLERAPWQFTGFTAWTAFENHVQSYALWCRDVRPSVVRALRSVLSRRVAFNRFQDVVNCQETRLARVAAQRMSVGAFWYSSDLAADPSIVFALPLLRAGFPFLKRSLYGGKLAERADQAALAEWLSARGHPMSPPHRR